MVHNVLMTALAGTPAVVTAAGVVPTLSDTVVTVGPLWDALVPYIASGMGLIITAAATWASYQFQRLTNMKLDQNARDALHSAAMTGVNLALNKAGVAAHEASFHIENAIIGEATGWVLKSVPDALKRLDISPDKVAAIVTSKIAALKNDAVVVPVPAVVEAIPEDAGKSPRPGISA